jgi:hypothetical protein
VSFDDLLDNPQADAEPGVVMFGYRPLERAEDSRLILDGDPDAFVAHGESRPLPANADAHSHGLPGTVRERVGEEMHHHLLDA